MRPLLLLLLITLAGCSKDFDNRYADAAKQVKEHELRIDKAHEKTAKKEAGER
jgi:hypothetical protein